ncbi:MAG TPA: hypothetical protein VKE22_30685 [Haliangiales bacterium]|nr:hypothetical protein [Haliangiales bacterium]
MRALAVLPLLAACGGAATGGTFPRDPVYLTLDGLDGDVSIPAFHGRVVIVHFATTWSLAAQADQTELGRAAARGAAVIEIMLDPDARLVRTWASAARLAWPVTLASPAVVDGKTAFGRVAVVPTTFVLDRAGRLAWAKEGPLAPRQLDAVILEASRAPP